jgi:dienelactone hydrolase
VRAVLVLVPGSNGDGRPMADEPFWQEFAARERLAIVACRFTDKPHEQGFIEEYVNVSRGSGQAFLDALTAFADRAHVPGIASAPILLWGMSAGGQFNYEFAAWKPERVAAFVVNKGGIYYTALAPKAARDVPGLLFIGEKDLESRKAMISGLAALNRRAGAQWALTEEPGVGHAVARSRDLGAMFFAEVLALRARGSSLTSIDPKAGFIADLKARTFQPAAGAPAQTEGTAWLPTLAIAKAWQAVVTGKPFEP